MARIWRGQWIARHVDWRQILTKERAMIVFKPGMAIVRGGGWGLRAVGKGVFYAGPGSAQICSGQTILGEAIPEYRGCEYRCLKCRRLGRRRVARVRLADASPPTSSLGNEARR